MHFWWVNIVVIVCTAAVIAAVIARARGWWRPSTTRAMAMLPYFLAVFTILACLLAVLGSTWFAIAYGVPTLVAWVIWIQPQHRTMKLYRAWIYMIATAAFVVTMINLLHPVSHH